MSTSQGTAATLLRMLVDGATTAQLVEVDADVAVRDHAVRLRAAIASGRRREAQLEALVETAKDLASMRDPAGVLDAIVRRARTLLRSDLAYLTLHDPERQDTFMRATAGSTSAAFQSVRLPLGSGLGGLVASTRMPYATSDYFQDERFRHTRGIDSAVDDEGIVAILGTPLLVGERFVGVLFAADRTVRTFDREEITLLGSLAALAAVSLVQARTLLEAQTALEALSLAHDTVRHHVAGVERAAAAHDRFAEVLLSGGGLDDVSRALGELLGAWVVLLDADDRRRSSFGDVPGDRDAGNDRSDLRDVGTDPLAEHPARLQTGATGRLAVEAGVHAIAIRAAGDHLGTLLVGGVGELDDADRRTVERAGVVSALVLLFERDAATSRRQFHTDLIADLAAERGERSDRIHAAQSLGLRIDQPFCVLALRGPATMHRRALALSASHVLGSASIVGEHDGVVVALAAGSDPAATAQDLAARLGGSHPVTVAASGPLADPDAIGAAVAEARRTLDALVALGHDGTGAAASALGFAGLIVGSEPDVAAYVSSVLGPVLEYDRARGTDLLPTLDAWFSSGQSPRHAATALHVHPNTVAQRLERVGRLLGDGWQQPDRALQAQLALHLRHLMTR